MGYGTCHASWSASHSCVHLLEKSIRSIYHQYICTLVQLLCGEQKREFNREIFGLAKRSSIEVSTGGGGVMVEVNKQHSFLFLV